MALAPPLPTALALPALQQPDWPDPTHLDQVLDELAAARGPVDAAGCRDLRIAIARAAAGEGFVVVGGDCAERLDDAGPDRIRAKAAHLHQTADTIAAAGRPVTRIARFGGQFAKPRSRDHEELADGRVIPSYRGDAVNGMGRDDRRPDAARLLAAHEATCRAVETLDEEERYGAPRTFLSHEALLLDYERALTRTNLASSAHYLWIGDRTRRPDHAHVAFAAAIANPVGVKLGPAAGRHDVRALAEALDPAAHHIPGRLSFIARMGVERCATQLPGIIDALGTRAAGVAWIVDPMHGNGRTNLHGQKTRLMADIRAEIEAFFAVLRGHGLTPAGIHLEMTPDDVTECVAGPRDLARWLPDYRSACDPRLNAEQSAEVAALVQELLR
jgi:3-deoxy-7-phosphoheptulonate synthase